MRFYSGCVGSVPAHPHIPPPSYYSGKSKRAVAVIQLPKLLLRYGTHGIQRFNDAEHLLPQIVFGRFTLGDLTSATETLRRCIHCKMQVQFLPSQELKYHRTARLFLPRVMRSIVIRNGK
jgi:hypothetical protein